MYGWVIYNGHLQGSKFLDFAESIHKAGKQNNVTIDIVKNNQLLSFLSEKGSNLLFQIDKPLPDFVIFGDKDITLAWQLESMQIPVFNSATAIDICDNKITTYQKLAENGLPIPKTVAAPKIFANVQDIDLETFYPIEKQMDYPMVVKEAYGSFGEQVYLVHNRKELDEIITEIKDRPFVIQEFISSSYGKDIRLNVVGNKVVSSMLRSAANDFRANSQTEGVSEMYTPTEKEVELAIQATKAIGVDFAGVDLLFGPNQQPIICEVNSNAHIKKTLAATGVDVADHIVKYVISKI
ncbi:ATP-grasp domain-containing protein [Aquibacillus kalidii]|uniref:ATP-grasp domain-containing protein n=1 Tax=Aquibacillus kalidii TaxID=2762597 RepID=UPI001648075E|nr:RimK family alpha-L-glutamate ligase [Aquibacillus kalidii]